jgi:hypothetical protein
MTSSDPLISPVLSKASVLDIVSYGYRTAIKHIWPITLIALPAILLNMIQGFNLPSTFAEGMARNHAARMAHSAAIVPSGSEFWGWAISLVELYFYYCISLYTRDAYFNQIDRPLYAYCWGEKKSLLAITLFGLLCVLLFIPYIVIGFIGFLFLLFPGVAWFSYISAAYNMSYAMLLQHPSRGVKATVSDVFRLLRQNAWRTVALGLVSWLVNFIIAVPAIIISFGVYTGIKLGNSLAVSLMMALSCGISNWISFLVGFGGFMFIMYRYIADLKIRHGDMDAESMLPAVIEQQI